MYMLDTNIASHVIKGDIASVRQKLAMVPIREVCVSVVTQAELLYGVAKRGHPEGLTKRVHEFLLRVDVLSWPPSVARVYAELRAECEGQGTPLAPLDMMIAAQAKEAGAILVTRDRAFARALSGLVLEDWTQ
jgi:tRNA(fMet)-specific endonuclease VapC